MAYLALGSNVGEREATLRQAAQRLRILPRTLLRALSRFYETAPVDAPPGSGPFINAAAALETDLSAAELMAALLDIERDLGRDRTAGIPRNAPRTLDLDLLLYGNAIITEPELTVPHSRIQDRLFVLEPLAEIAPQVRHPLTGQTVREMLHSLKEQTNV